MASQGFSRKRPAPGAEPLSYPSQMQNPAPAFNDGLGQQLSNDQFLQWGQTGQPTAGPSYNDNSYAMNANTYPQNNPPNIPQPSNQLTRRPMAQITSRVPQPNQDGNNWMESSNGGTNPHEQDWGDDIAELEARAQVAKREAQSKRKQIPPFVQKLNSFLEDGRNTELIRWSDDGNSFIVLDEDEFAKTLIPELFKHNNYASFVRQLNMYGFHKKVGLSDNSMRASEKKNKSPSEYSNPYFRRGHPELLWLIQKPKNVPGPASKRKKTENEQNDEEVDEYVEDAPPAETRVRPRPGQLTLGSGSGEMTLTQDQFKSVQQQLANIRHQQTHISRVMQQMKRDQEQLYGQAATFQDQHNRHENSINAILTFLATVYNHNRNVQGHDSVPGIASMFQNAMPVDTSSSGNVVDVGDYTFNDINLDGSPAKPFKRQPLLLTNGTSAQQQGRANTLSPRTASNSPYPSRAQPGRAADRHSPLSPAVEEVFDPGVNSPDSAPTPATQSRTGLPSRDMMSVIQSANARNNSTSSTTPTTPAQDFSSVLSSLENSSATGPLTNTQRADMLRLINNTASSTNAGQDNALINATPPPGPANFHRRLQSTQADFDALARLQAEQDKSVQNLTNLLQPLSPTGSIPGIHDSQQLPPPPLDIDDFLNHNEYFADFPGSDGNTSYDFGNTGLGGAQVGASPGVNFGEFKDDDDDELFGNLDNNSAAAGFGYDGANDSAGVVDGSYDQHDGGGRVESVPSSEVTTPKSDGERKASENEVRGGRKRVRT
ncbi:Heat shock transcription factor [Cladophialophora chaetospira]|uniref:Heat shock transcription factor n=1 Tax=Cladophialophora chaetospira TaxID=386627 RepID=A0AA39CB96_9EURO|nr:Heat shock transcription factor [Cladophialophora chaetospira]